MNIYAFILARGGSKGVPGKNIRPLMGKPLITWTIEEAKKVKEITRVFVTTDDEKIAEVSRQAGAEVLERPAELASDSALGFPVFEYHLEKLRSEGSIPDVVIDLRPTSPLRRANRIKEGIDLLLEAGPDGVDSVRAVVEAHKHPYKMWRFEGKYITPFLPESFTHMKEPFDAVRQELPDVYQNNGAMYAIWPKTIFEKKSLTGEKVIGYVMEDWESVNIDTEIDFLMAEELIKRHPMKD